MGFSLFILSFNCTLCEWVISTDLFTEGFFFFFFHSLIKSHYEVMVSKLWPTKIPNAPHSLTSFPHWGYMCVCVCVHIRACALSFCFYDSGQWFWVEERELIKDKIIFDLKMTCQLYLDMFVTLFFDILEY